MIRTMASLGIATAVLSGSHHGATDAQFIRVQTTDPAATVKVLAGRGAAILDINRENGTSHVDAYMPPSVDASRLEGLAGAIVRREAATMQAAPDTGYASPEEIGSRLRAYAEAHPHLAQLHQIGRSVEDRPLWALRIHRRRGPGREVDLAKAPIVLLNGMHHAREVMSPEVVLDAIDQLLTNYGTDPKVRNWVDTVDIWTVPMLNVDGSAKVWDGRSMWRKNARGGYGVDLNRNYPYRWNGCNGSSGSRHSDTYRGDAPASEPETRALMELVGRLHPVFDISFHSYGEMVLYPYGCPGETPAPITQVAAIGRALADLLPRDGGSGTYRAGTPFELLYAADGGDIDWMFSEYGVIPYVIELNAGFGSGGFQPSFSRRDPTVAKLRQAWSYLLDRVSGSGLRGRVKGPDGRPLRDARIRVTQTGTGASSQGTAWRRSDAGGHFHMIVAAGRYKMRVTKEGFVSEERFVLVEDSPRSQNFRLQVR